MSKIHFERPIDTVDRDGNPFRDLPKVAGHYVCVFEEFPDNQYVLYYDNGFCDDERTPVKHKVTQWLSESPPDLMAKSVKQFLVERLDLSEFQQETMYEDYVTAVIEHSAIEVAKATQKLQAFKDYVHKRLDEAGVPTNPDGEHSKAGCRIGDRLDIVLKAKQ